MDKKFLIDYLNTDSPSCYEIEAQKLWVSKMTPLSDEIETDNYGNAYALLKSPKMYDKIKVVLDAHCDEIGGFIISEVFKRLKQEDIALPFDLYAVNSVQEEVGLRGAKMITETIKPNIAICFDVGFDTNTPMVDKEKWGDFKMGGGLIFRQGYDVHPNLLNLMKKTADDEKIPYTLSVGGAGGTNTTSYNLSNGGVVTSILSIPLRYMHTPNEMVSTDDIELAINFIVELLMNIKYNHNFKLVK